VFTIAPQKLITPMKFLLKSIFIYSTFLLFFPSYIQAQQPNKSVLSGYVRDSKTGEELIGVTVFIKENGKGTVTNEYGYYSITLLPNTYTVTIKYVGYNTINQSVNLSTSLKTNFELVPLTKELKTINVVGERKDENIKTTEMSTNKLDMKNHY
jgi:hypothetical protein